MLDATDSQIRKALVTLSIERVLLNIGRPVLEDVTRRLYQEHKCYLPDCYERPQFLKKVLQDLYGTSHAVIVESIKNNLEEFSYQKPIEKFIKVIGG